MRNESYITIQGWMINELGLSGNELLCYALIYGFSQDGESSFNGSRKYIAEIIGAKSMNTVDKNLATLVERGLLLKTSKNINGVIINSYRVNFDVHPLKFCAPPSKFEHPYSNFEHYNNSNNNSNKNERDKSLSKSESEDELFEQCWKEYRRKGHKAEAKKQWKQLKQSEKDEILHHIKAYVSSRDLQYQQDFERYLRHKTFNSLVVSKNNVVYNPSLFDYNEYSPQCDGISLMWNEFAQCYMTPFDIESVADGYTKDNRPNGAIVMWRGYKYIWNNESKNWIKQD